MSKRISWAKTSRCRNCNVEAKCWLCRDCWRMAIVSPLVIASIEQAVAWTWHFLK